MNGLLSRSTHAPARPRARGELVDFQIAYVLKAFADAIVELRRKAAADPARSEELHRIADAFEARREEFRTSSLELFR